MAAWREQGVKEAWFDGGREVEGLVALQQTVCFADVNLYTKRTYLQEAFSMYLQLRKKDF